MVDTKTKTRPVYRVIDCKDVALEDELNVAAEEGFRYVGVASTKGSILKVVLRKDGN